MTITLSESSRTFLKEYAARKNQTPGKIADDLIQMKRVECHRQEIGKDFDTSPRHPEPPKPRLTETENQFFADHKDRMVAMRNRFASKLALERRRAQRGKPWSGNAWKHLDAKERSRIGGQLIYKAQQDVKRWFSLRSIPASQHSVVKRVLELYGNKETQAVRAVTLSQPKHARPGLITTF